MAEFGTKSRLKLDTCDERLQNILNEVVEVYDCSILEGHRSIERQAELFASGRSKVKLGKHNAYPSLAVDVAPYPVDWMDRERFISFGAFLKGVAHEKGIKIRWGADWDSDWDFKDQHFDDLVHFELVIEEE